MAFSEMKIPARRDSSIHLDRRSIIRLGMASAFLPGVMATSASASASPSSPSQLDLLQEISSEILHEDAWAFFRAVYDSLDLTDIQSFLSYYLQSDLFDFYDATINISLVGYQAFVASETPLLAAFRSDLGPGRVSKIFHVTGDLRYGAVVEHVFPQNVFFSTNGFAVQSVIDMSGGLISRNIDYWDSRQLGQADVTGPATTTGVARPVGAVNSGGIPRTGIVPPTRVGLASGVDGHASASPAMVSFVEEFAAALSQGSVRDVLGFFTEDAIYVNPIIHQGPAFYGAFDQTIQIRGRRLLRSFFEAALSLLPDGPGSRLVHIVGSAAGGGFEWKAGGPYGSTGLDRSGLIGSTALDFSGDKIRRMSVKFDTFQMPATLYNQIRAALVAGGVIDQAS